MVACDDREGFYLERKEKRQQDAEERGGEKTVALNLEFLLLR
jgi:hypothetical protein